MCIFYSIQSWYMAKIVKLGPELQSNKLSDIPKLNVFNDSGHYGMCQKLKEILLKDDPAIYVLTLANC